jgi:hypothetical protein
MGCVRLDWHLNADSPAFALVRGCVTENDPRGNEGEGQTVGFGWRGVLRPPWACVQGMMHGVFICRRLGVEAGRRCGVGVAGLGGSSGSAVNPGRLPIVLEASRDTRHPFAATASGDIMSRTHRALVMLALCLALATATTAVAVAAQPTPPTIEDQNDRLLRNLQGEQAAREQTAVEAARSMERNLTPASTADRPAAAQPDPAPGTAMPSRGVDVLATLLVGLVGGLAGGAAVMAGWTATTRRRLRRAASVA